MFNNNFFFSKIVPFYEIMRKNIVQPDRPQMITWSTRVAFWILRPQTHSLRMYNIYCFSTTIMVVRTCLSVTLHVHCLSCLVIEAGGTVHVLFTVLQSIKRIALPCLVSRERQSLLSFYNIVISPVSVLLISVS